MKKFHDLNIAIVHDSIQYYGGAERVLTAMHAVFPRAHIYTSVIVWENLGLFTESVRSLNIRTSWIQRIPFVNQRPYLFRYILPILWQSFDFTGYDVVISSTGAQMSQLVKVKSPAKHMCYFHTPPRHLYGYRTDFDWENNSIFKRIIPLVNRWLIKIDKKAVSHIDVIFANSREVANRIKQIYSRDASVLPPPICLSVPELQAKGTRTQYFLSVSRLSRMKHLDVIIRACNRMHAALHIVGIGPEEAYLRKISGPTIHFLKQISDDALARQYSGCTALICAAEDEDFGITPLEATGFGKPVIAYYSGGYKETVIQNKTGIFFHQLTTESLIESVKKFQRMDFFSGDSIKKMQKFTFHSFQREFEKAIMRLVQE